MILDKRSLKYRMEKVGLTLFNFLIRGNESPAVIKKIFKIINSLREFNQSFIHMFLLSFCEILKSFQVTTYDVIGLEIIKYIEKMLKYNLKMDQFTCLIISSLITVIQNHPMPGLVSPGNLLAYNSNSRRPKKNI